MNRLVWVLLALLVLTNVAWFLTRAEDSERPPAAPGGEATGGASRTPANRTSPPAFSPPPAGRPVPGARPGGGPGTAPALEIDMGRVAELKSQWIAPPPGPGGPVEPRNVAAEVLRALATGPAEETLAALQSLPSLRLEESERKSIRPLLVGQAYAPDPRFRMAAINALGQMDAEPGDIELYVALLNDPSRDVRKQIARAVGEACHWQIQGSAAMVFSVLLKDPDLSVRLEALRALNDAEWIADEITREVLALCSSEDRLVALSATNALSGATQTKSEKVVEMLLGTLRDESAEFREEARRGLTHGIPDTLVSTVISAVVELLPAQQELADRIGNLKLIGAHGNPSHLEMLGGLAEDPNLPELVREEAKRAAEAIRARAGE